MVADVLAEAKLVVLLDLVNPACKLWIVDEGVQALLLQGGVPAAADAAGDALPPAPDHSQAASAAASRRW